MKVYRTDEIRNVVLLGHGGSGKTSLAEAMASSAGTTKICCHGLCIRSDESYGEDHRPQYDQ